MFLIQSPWDRNISPDLDYDLRGIFEPLLDAERADAYKHI